MLVQLVVKIRHGWWCLVMVHVRTSKMSVPDIRTTFSLATVNIHSQTDKAAKAAKQAVLWLHIRFLGV